MKKVKTAMLGAVFLCSYASHAQDSTPQQQEIIDQVTKTSTYPQYGGIFQLGMRTTTSLFGDAGYNGLGVGGQFRISFGKRMNSEWFSDLITTNLANLGKRVDGHIGWSVMFYPWTTPKIVKPYLIAGHCFDFTKVTPYSTLSDNRSDEIVKRWSSATQIGLGTHFLINRFADISLSTQYMVHLGKSIHTEIDEHDGIKELHVEEHAQGELGLEGHLLITLSLNFRIAQLWKAKN
ncbi:MAG: hypothetical protein ACHQF2_03155 [Flavobacteriales bacterium]